MSVISHGERCGVESNHPRWVVQCNHVLPLLSTGWVGGVTQTHHAAHAARMALNGTALRCTARHTTHGTPRHSKSTGTRTHGTARHTRHGTPRHTTANTAQHSTHGTPTRPQRVRVPPSRRRAWRHGYTLRLALDILVILERFFAKVVEDLREVTLAPCVPARCVGSVSTMSAHGQRGVSAWAVSGQHTIRSGAGVLSGHRRGETVRGAHGSRAGAGWLRLRRQRR